jgi:molecular chaperone GrpE
MAGFHLYLPPLRNKKAMEHKKTETPEEKDTQSVNADTSADMPVQEAAEEAKLVDDVASKLKEINEKYTRLYAEYDNYRRRTAKEKIELIKSGGEDVILSVLPVLDDMERAIAHHKDSADHKPLQEGLELICQKMNKILTAKGVAPMGEKGEVFNPDLHEAITNLPAGTDDMKGKIMEVVEKGYTLNGKVIRHAKVVVGS